jgi:putative FmdB family regulatory protein
MPTYDYRCSACGHLFEQFQSIHSKPIRTCPVCGEEQVNRLFTGGSGLIFKGSGFYSTDYKSAGSKEAAPPRPEEKSEKKTE